MPITRWALESFLAAPKENFEFMKDLKHEDLDWHLNGLVPRPYFDNQPMDLHQKVGFILGLSHGSFYLQYEMGLGKTRIALELCKYRLELSEIKLALVLVPTDTIVLGWRDEATKWMPHIPMLTLVEMSTEEKWAALDAFTEGVVVVTYQAWLWMVSELMPGKKGRKKLELSQKKLRKMEKLVDFMVGDEATKISSRESLIFVGMRNMAKHVDHRLLLAGRPFGKDPVDLWSQYYIVDLGETLGETLGLFREAFYTEKDKFGKDSTTGGAYWMKFKNKRMMFAKEYTFRKDREADLTRFLNNRALYYATEEAIDLPPLIPIPRYAKLPDRQRQYYDAMIERRWKKAKEGEVIRPENTFLRMRQLASGYLGMRDADTDEKVEIFFPENPKLDMLLDVLDEMPQHSQALIYYEFTVTGRLIHEAMKKAGHAHGWVWGETKTSAYDTIKKTFDTTPGYDILGNWKKIGTGVNGQSANYVIMFEPPTNPTEYAQCIARARRKGSLEKHDKIFLVNLVVLDTKDQPILDAIKVGDDLHTRILKSPRFLYDQSSDTPNAQGRVAGRPSALARQRPQRPKAAHSRRPGVQGSNRSGIRR